jgi:hypothetical protein
MFPTTNAAAHLAVLLPQESGGLRAALGTTDSNPPDGFGRQVAHRSTCRGIAIKDLFASYN